VTLRLLTLAWRASAAVTRWLALRRVIALDRARVKAICEAPRDGGWVEITDDSGVTLARIALEKPFPGRRRLPTTPARGLTARDTRIMRLVPVDD
jgi:hypothetical protein